MNKNLARLMQQATTRRAEITLPELFDVFELDSSDSTLAKVVMVSKHCADLGLRLMPDVDQGEVDTVRRLELAEPLPITDGEVIEDIQRGEAENLEMKSSLLYDHARAKQDPSLTIVQLKSEAVLHSSLRTIAAFLTCNGGVLYVGVDDTGKVLGIEFDFACVSDTKEKQNPDQWELHLRNLVQSRFKDGKSVNDYVSCAVIPVEGRLVARIDVSPRTKLSFLDAKGTRALYRRQGNRTVEVGIDEVEEFLEFRKGFRA